MLETILCKTTSAFLNVWLSLDRHQEPASVPFIIYVYLSFDQVVYSGNKHYYGSGVTKLSL